jgi:hypothetical protein
VTNPIFEKLLQQLAEASHGTIFSETDERLLQAFQLLSTQQPTILVDCNQILADTRMADGWLITTLDALALLPSDILVCVVGSELYTTQQQTQLMNFLALEQNTVLFLERKRFRRRRDSQAIRWKAGSAASCAVAFMLDLDTGTLQEFHAYYLEGF